MAENWLAFNSKASERNSLGVIESYLPNFPKGIRPSPTFTIVFIDGTLEAGGFSLTISSNLTVFSNRSRGSWGCIWSFDIKRRDLIVFTVSLFD
jgi:hypothetical protein